MDGNKITVGMAPKLMFPKLYTKETRYVVIGVNRQQPKKSRMWAWP